MSRELLLEKFGRISLLTGIPPRFSGHAIPAALYFHAKGPWGILFLQEIKTPKYLLRHFLFSLKQPISLFYEDSGNKLQSLNSIDGCIDFQIKGQEKVELKKKEYLLFNTAGLAVLTTVHKGNTSILSTQYASDLYRDLVPYFTGLKDDLKKAVDKSFCLKQARNETKCSVHDAIKAIWQEECIPILQAKHIELRLEDCLFKMLAQSYEAKKPVVVSSMEKKLAVKAKEIILQDLKVHLTPEEIALQLNCSASWLRKAFRKAYGTPMFKFLRSNRMHHARQQILNGVSVKAVSIELGINPSNFPKEFKTFFGYNVSSLKRGHH